MDVEQVQVGRRVRVHVPGLGDHGQVGIVKKVRGDRCYVHLDWDTRPTHVVLFYAADLEPIPDKPLTLGDLLADDDR